MISVCEQPWRYYQQPWDKERRLGVQEGNDIVLSAREETPNVLWIRAERWGLYT